MQAGSLIWVGSGIEAARGPWTTRKMAASHQSSAGDAPRCQVPGCDEALPEDAAYYKVGPTL